MTLRRGGTQLMGGGGVNNVPTLEASNQFQIDDLVQRNRTLEHTNKKLSEQLSQEHSRSKDTIVQLQSQWDINQSHWKQTCENLLGLYRIVQKHVQVELEKERTNTLKEMKLTRDEKLLSLQRNFEITLFQIKEEELERRVEDVEVEKTTLMQTNDMVVQKLQGRCAEYVIKLRDTQALLSRSEKEKEEKETKLNKLVEGRANLEASSESIKSKLERTKLQLDGAQSKNLDLERSSDELKRTNSDLTRQLEKWQSLETKKGEAADTERKQRIVLEIKLREVTEFFEKKLAKAAADVERANARVEKIKGTVKEWEGAYEDVRTEAKTSQKQLAKALERIEALKLELEALRAEKVRPPSPDQDRAPPPPARKNGKRKAISDDDDDIQVVEQPKRQKTKTGRARSEIREATRTRTKPSSSRATSKQPPIASSPSEERDDNGGEGADVALQNPKKRKINIFPTGNDAIQFSFGGMSSLNGDKLNIPTTLSPVKEDELVPSRSMYSMIQRRR